MAFKPKWKNPTGTRTYFSWRNMRYRCNNQSSSAYKHYGGRGITICKEWESYDQFYADMGPAPDGMSLDRKDNNKGYEPSNCKWSTVEEQLNNQRRNLVLCLGSKKQTASQWAKELGLSPDTLYKRLKRMPTDRALSSGRLVEWKHGTRAGYEGNGCRCNLCKASNAERGRKVRSKRKERLLKKLEGI